jgi:hypothetical protein
MLPYSKYGPFVNMTNLFEITDTHYQDVLAQKKAAFEESESLRKEEERQHREAEIEKAKQEATQREIERIAAQEKQKELLAQQEAKRQAEEAAKASDKDKWGAFIKALSAVPVPEMKSTIYKTKVTAAQQKIDTIIYL